MKHVKTYKGWQIYQEGSTYYAYVPGESPESMDYPEWEAALLSEIINFIDLYDQ